MPRNGTTGVFTRVSNSFSNPVAGTTVSPTDADTYFDDLDAGLTFNATNPLMLVGSSSGATTVKAAAAASGTITVPAATDTLVGKATTDTLTNKTFDSAGTGNTLKVSGVTVSAGQYPGETTTGNATAGNVGEYVSSSVVSGSAVAITTATPKTVTSISLTAGDWDVSGIAAFLPANTTQVTQVVASISTTTDTLSSTPGNLSVITTPATTYDGSTQANATIPAVRLSLSGTTTVYLVAMSKFTTSTNGAFGIIQARRAR